MKQLWVTSCPYTYGFGEKANETLGRCTSGIHGIDVSASFAGALSDSAPQGIQLKVEEHARKGKGALATWWCYGKVVEGVIAFVRMSSAMTTLHSRCLLSSRYAPFTILARSISGSSSVHMRSTRVSILVPKRLVSIPRYPCLNGLDLRASRVKKASGITNYPQVSKSESAESAGSGREKLLRKYLRICEHNPADCICLGNIDSPREIKARRNALQGKPWRQRKRYGGELAKATEEYRRFDKARVSGSAAEERDATGFEVMKAYRY